MPKVHVVFLNAVILGILELRRHADDSGINGYPIEKFKHSKINIMRSTRWRICSGCNKIRPRPLNCDITRFDSKRHTGFSACSKAIGWFGNGAKNIPRASSWWGDCERSSLPGQSANLNLGNAGPVCNIRHNVFTWRSMHVKTMLLFLRQSL